MKKGLRHIPGCNTASLLPIPTADLMKKGLRLPLITGTYLEEWNSNRRPDEEGIKTPCPDRLFRRQLIPTADLMKKGLRHSLSDTPHKSVAFQPQT